MSVRGSAQTSKWMCEDECVTYIVVSANTVDRCMHHTCTHTYAQLVKYSI